MGITYKKGKNKKGKILIFLLIILELVIFFSGYLVGYNKGKKLNVSPSEPTLADEETAKEKDKAEELLGHMSLSDMVYQMMFVTPESITGVGTVIQAGDATKTALEEYPVGGIVYFSPNLIDRAQTVEMIKNTQSFSEIPLFIGVDEEGGRVSRVGNNNEMGTTHHPAMSEIGKTKDFSKACKIGEVLAKELGELGFNVDFAPVADVLVNKENTEIGDRSFGADVDVVSEMVKSMLLAMEENGLSATLKHFPGHGSSIEDSHEGSSVSHRSMEEIKALELKPFVEGINNKVDFIMVSHLTFADATSEKVPSSLSKEIITELLINELGYNGIIITDALNMGAIQELYSDDEAAVKAIEAGADMILMPSDVKNAHDVIVKAVSEGRITEERIKTSVKKILELKIQKKML